MAGGTGDAYPGEQRLGGNFITLFQSVKGWKREQIVLVEFQKALPLK